MTNSTLIKKLSMAAIGSTLIALGVGGAAQANVLTFDELPPTSYGNPIPNTYGGFNWNNFYYLTSSIYGIPNTGYQNGTVSGENVAFNAFAQIAIVGDGLFDFNSTYLTAAWNNGLNILVEGISGGVTKYSEVVVVDTNAPTLFNFDFLGIDNVKFTSYGGVNAGLGGGGEHFAMDNFTFNETKPVPEPASTLGLLAFGAIGATSALKRKKGQNTQDNNLN